MKTLEARIGELRGMQDRQHALFVRACALENEIERLRGAMLLMRGRLLMENPHAVTTEADALLLGPNVRAKAATTAAQEYEDGTK